MDGEKSGNGFSNAWRASPKIDPNGISSRNLHGTKNGFTAHGSKFGGNDQSISFNDGRVKFKTVKRLALIVNIVGATLSFGILINRASICIQK